ncbi:MAG: PEGA domain-containing protein [Bacteroidales bacterium]|nr:PEGA domain-containing protein [Bacteroidales bacterium]
MKRILLVIFALISLNAFSQLQVKEGSFKYLPGGVIEDKETYTDGNESPMALIKISTENIPEQERMRLVFTGNRETQILKVPKTGQMWIYISAEAATFIDIKHPDYGTYKYYLPEKLCDYCKYEMVLQYVNNNSSNTYISVDSEPSGADIYIDGKHYGKTPNIITDLPMGKHEMKLEKQEYNPVTKIFIIEEGEKLKFNETLLSVYYKASAVEDDKVVAIEKEKPQKKEKPEKKPVEKVKPEKKAESLPKTSFLTLNAAYSLAPQMSFGFTYGQVKKLGWYVSAMSNFGTRFTAKEWDDLIYIDEAIASGKSSNARLSLTGGLVCRLFEPVYLKVGAGYGMRVKCWELNDTWYEYPRNSYKGLDLSAGLMFNVKGCTISADAVTTDFKYMEVKIGVGLNWN